MTDAIVEARGQVRIPARRMRAKYINKTARRRTIRPDGDHIRTMRRYRGDGRRRARAQWIAATAAIAMLIVVYFAFLRG